ncbi:MAG: DNA translocase FtsK [Thiothrix sp.]|uniref:DNA translocase FtsK n=1 Tax=Thiothrix sp. TaxID=1032 RepID=UPI00263764AF|nr:DNA translocase FtsK [Thiothrix sp.]MDD5395347.1 DNA translocase FtsK [Thiothrix sp.]
MTTTALTFITDAKRRRARASKLKAVTGSNPAVGVGDFAGTANKPPADGVLVQLSHKLAWVGHIRLPRISVRPEMLAGAGLGVAVGAGLYISWDAIAHAMETVDAQLVAPDWYKPALSALGQASTLGVAAGLYSLQWAVRTGAKHLPTSIAYVLLGTVASAPVLTVCGFNGGMVGQYVAGLLQAQGVAPAVVAASGTLLALFTSMRIGNPLVKLAMLFDLLGGAVTNLLPEGKVEPAVKVPPAPVVATNTTFEDALKAKMQETLEAYKLGYASVQQVLRGPVLTTFMVEIPLGKDTKEIAKQDINIGRAFRAKGQVKVVEHVSGTAFSAIEVPNAKRDSVALAGLMATPEWAAFGAELPMLLGVDALGKPMMLDMAKAVHLLVAGTTGSGKSVFVNALLMSLMSRMTPATLRIHLIDPKMLEFSLYEGSPFVEGEVITDMELVRPMLEQLVGKMEARYKVMAHHKVRNIVEYNAKAAETGEFNPMPYGLVVFDEFADLIMQDKQLQRMAKVKDEDGNTVVVTAAEELIARLAQKARASGIHLLLSTQRPTADVITGLIKTNVPTRIGMTVSTSKDSMNMLDVTGCEKLLGNGDAYGILPGNKALQRIHGGYVDGDEIGAQVAQQVQRWGK